MIQKQKVVATIGILMLGVFLSSVARAENVKVRIGSVKGSVEAQIGGAWKAVKNNDKVDVGTAVKTGADSSCLLLWNDGNIVKVQSLSMVTVEEASKDGAKENSTMKLTNGKMFATAKKLTTGDSSFRVKTPTAVAGVRGTDIGVGVEGGASTFQVAAGSIDVALPGGEPVILDQGTQVGVTEGMASVPMPEPIPPAELQELQSNISDVKVEAEAAMSEAGAGGEEKQEATKEEAASSEESTSSETTETTEATAVDTDSVTNSVDNTLQNEANNQASLDQSQSAIQPGDTIIVIQ